LSKKRLNDSYRISMKIDFSEEHMFCTECGGNINASDRVCPSCGARAQDDRPAPMAAPRVARPVAADYAKPGFGVMGITRSVLGALAQGRVIRNAIALVMRIGALLVLLGGLFVVIQVLKMSFQISSAAATIGGVLLAVLMAAAFFAVAQIYLFRAQSVYDLEDSPFTIIPILSILFRASGEAYAIGAIAFGVGGCLFTWLSGMSPTMLLSGLGVLMPPIPFLGEMGSQSFVSGLVFLVSMIVAGFATLIAFYALAELVVVLVDIAINVRRLVKGQAAVPA
jgi:hypothetical protein